MNRKEFVNMINQTCWICKRTEKELSEIPLEESISDMAKLSDVEMHVVNGVKICGFCADIINSLIVESTSEHDQKIDKIEEYLSNIPKY